MDIIWVISQITLSCISLIFIEIKYIHCYSCVMLVDLMTIYIKTPKIDSGCSLDKDFNKLMHMNPLMVLYLTANQSDSCFDYVHGPSTNTKDILWIDDCVLIITYKTSYVGYNIKPLKMIVWSRLHLPPSIFKEIDLRNETL